MPSISLLSHLSLSCPLLLSISAKASARRPHFAANTHLSSGLFAAWATTARRAAAGAAAGRRAGAAILGLGMEASALIAAGRAAWATTARGAATARRASTAGRAATEAREEASISCRNGGAGEGGKWEGGRRKGKREGKVQKKSGLSILSRSEERRFDLTRVVEQAEKSHTGEDEMRAAAVSLPRPGPGRLPRGQVRDDWKHASSERE